MNAFKINVFFGFCFDFLFERLDFNVFLIDGIVMDFLKFNFVLAGGIVDFLYESLNFEFFLIDWILMDLFKINFVLAGD